MAQAQKTIIDVPVTTYKQQTQVTLTMSFEEAQTIRDILGKVGGSPSNTRRRHAGLVLEALAAAGVARKYSVPWEFSDCSGSITFHPDPENL